MYTRMTINFSELTYFESSFFTSKMHFLYRSHIGRQIVHWGHPAQEVDFLNGERSLKRMTSPLSRIEEREWVSFGKPNGQGSPTGLSLLLKIGHSFTSVAWSEIWEVLLHLCLRFSFLQPSHMWSYFLSLMIVIWPRRKELKVWNEIRKNDHS